MLLDKIFRRCWTHSAGRQPHDLSNDLPAHLAVIVVRGAPVEVEMIASGGQRIEQHAAAGLAPVQLASGRQSVLGGAGAALTGAVLTAAAGAACAA